ncbi:hypothetical protein P154DRAFT_556221 [Amniculicola lignicola CBS 123094]|uniref:Uncharacterized protein n=1 Tax=Amniculicola lignicola CBS 123094 TaxID=1392246 RepID=A0A6A5W3N0_9PLEO|nr:hypothetical protein P154DRAFT_556221 [Amniculicola lignicola CBS 123094]
MAADDDLPWTTSRCNRLLRPVSSRIATLRKELEQRTTNSETRRASASSFTKKASPRSSKFSQPAKANKPRGFDKLCDPDWAPGAKPKTSIKRTYGGRASKTAGATQREVFPDHNTRRPGEIPFTPLVARVGNRMLESPQLQGSPLRQPMRKQKAERAEEIQNLKKMLPDDIAKLVNSLFDGYTNLLQTTRSDAPKGRKGVRSLFSACLHKMPAYIELEEYWAQVDAEEEDEDQERNLSDEIYTHLEQTFGPRVDSGWAPLNQVVRAHGTALLCDAFVDQILGQEALEVIVLRCLKMSAWDEAEKFLWAIPPSLEPLSIPASLRTNLFSSHKYMQLVKHFVEITGRFRFLYDVLEYMMSQELLPLEWLATECMRPVWNRLVRSFSNDDQRTNENALRFLETAMSLGMGLPDDSVFEEDAEVDVVSKQIRPSVRQDLRDALDTTYSSLLTLLSSIPLVSATKADDGDDLTGQRVTWVLDSLVIGLLKRKDVEGDLELLDPSTEDMQTFTQRALWLVFCALLVHLGGGQFQPGLINLDINILAGALGWTARQYTAVDVDLSSVMATFPALISSMARCAGKAWKDDGFDQLQRLTDELLTVNRIRLPHKTWSLKRLALEASLEFAHGTNDAHHFAYARQIEQKMRSNGRIVLMSSPQKPTESPTTGGGFRWEEGIGEWVHCTPFAKQNVKRLPRKPMRALELLPTPVPSEDEGDISSNESYSDKVFSDHSVNAQSQWDQDTIMSSDDEEAPQSSPVKQPQPAVLKRKRAASPMVVIPIKHENQDEDGDEEDQSFSSSTTDPGPRRSRRSRKEIKAVIRSLRSTRSSQALATQIPEFSGRGTLEASKRSSLDRDVKKKKAEKRGSRRSLNRSAKTGVWAGYVEDDSADELGFQ